MKTTRCNYFVLALMLCLGALEALSHGHGG